MGRVGRREKTGWFMLSAFERRAFFSFWIVLAFWNKRLGDLIPFGGVLASIKKRREFRIPDTTVSYSSSSYISIILSFG
jgi:hypothetical protein